MNKQKVIMAGLLVFLLGFASAGASAEKKITAICSQTGESVNPNHPEKLPGEMFVGNFTAAGFDRLPYKTKRRGKEAIKSLDYEPSDYYPAKIGDHYHPVFANEKEHNQLYAHGRHWASDRGRLWRVTEVSNRYEYRLGMFRVLTKKNIRFAWNENQGNDRYGNYSTTHPVWGKVKDIKKGDYVWLDITPDGEVTPTLIKN